MAILATVELIFLKNFDHLAMLQGRVYEPTPFKSAADPLFMSQFY